MTRSNFGSVQYFSKGKYRIFWPDGYDADGLRIRRSRIVNGSRDDAERELAREMLAAGRAPACELTHRQAWDLVMPPKLAGYQATTRRNAEQSGRYLLAIVGDAPVGSIDGRLVSSVVESGMAPSVARNVAEARFSMPEPGRKRDNGVVVTTFADMAPIADALAAVGNDCTRRIAATGLYMGLRPEERYGLDWEDFAPDMRTARIERALVTASPAEGGVQLKGTKTEKSRRTVPVPARARELLLASGRGTGPLIVGAAGGRISPSTARKRWARFLREAAAAGFDVPPVTVENMRHSFATSFLHAGGNVEDLSRILGHSDINTTYRRYVRPSADDLVAAVDALLG